MISSTDIVMEPSSNMEACRSCLRLIDMDSSPFYKIEFDDVQLSTESCRYKLMSIVPEMALEITPKSMLCAECHGSLEALFKFKEKCLKTENIIAQYFQVNPDLDIKNLDLKDVSAFNVADVKISGNKTAEVSDQDVGVKEEIEVCDTTITNIKHEVEDFSSESVEVAWPKNAMAVSNFTCKYCDKCCKDSSSLKIHLRTHAGKKLAEASDQDVGVKEETEVCDTIITNVQHDVDDFSSESVEVVRPENKVPCSNFTCKYCDKRWKNPRSLKIHLRTHEQSNVCTACGKSCSSNSKLTVHMRTHTGEKPYRCEICDRRFQQKRDLTIHLCAHTGEKPYRCETCDRSFTSKDYLKMHLRIHTGQTPYHCKICERQFKQKQQLNAHLRTHSNEWPYVCTVCGKGCPSNSRLTIHMYSHTGEKPHRCEICDRRFQQKHDLTLHLRTHTSEKLYNCETCDRSFAHKCNFTTHLRIHTGEKPHRCEICDRRFQQKHDLTVHLRTHTGEKPYRCETCDRSFTQNSNFKAHLRIHTS